MKAVMITGINGQDGSILADKYLKKGWKVVGIDRWSPTGIYTNLIEASKNSNLILETGDISQEEYVRRMVRKYMPDIIYNMAAISLVPESFKIPRMVLDVNTGGVLNFLECIREFSPKTKFYQASTSEQIGKSEVGNQNTDSKMSPNSPYAISKLASYFFVKSYREAFGIFGTNGMLWNHEGPRRGLNFVTRKISRAAARISLGLQNVLELGFLDTYRDWGLADEYCDAMILMMESDKPDDYAVNTGETHSIREFVNSAFNELGTTLTWEGIGVNEVGKDEHGIVKVKINPEYYRPVEVPYLKGDHSKIEKQLGWTPQTKFEDLVKIMVSNDLTLAKEEKLLQNNKEEI